MGELGRRSDEHDGAGADHPTHRLHLHPLRHLVHRHVPECCAHASFGDQLILILGKMLMLSKFSPDSHPKQFGGLVKGCMGCHWNQHLTNLAGKKYEKATGNKYGNLVRKYFLHNLAEMKNGNSIFNKTRNLEKFSFDKSCPEMLFFHLNSSLPALVPVRLASQDD